MTTQLSRFFVRLIESNIERLCAVVMSRVLVRNLNLSGEETCAFCEQAYRFTRRFN